MRNLFLGLVMLFLVSSIHGQVKLQVVAKRVITKLNKDCDGAGSGDSDFVFEYKVTDNSPFNYSSASSVLNVLTYANYTYINGNNGPFSYTPSTITDGAFVPSNGIFFDKTYNCVSQVPTAFTLKWMAYENDNVLNYSITNATIQGETALQTILMPVPAVNGSQEFTYTAVSSDTDCAQSYEIVFEIIRSYGNTIPLLTPNLTEQFICAGTNTGVLSAGNVGGFGTVTYDWSYDGLGDMNDANTINDVGTGTYTINLKDVQNCTATATQVISAIPDLLPINQFVDSTLNSCVSTSGVSYSIVPQNDVIYNWSYSGSGVTIHGTEELVTLDFDVNATSGILSVNVQDMCMTTADHSVSIDVHTLPDVQILGSTTSCENAETVLVATGAQDFTWDSGEIADTLVLYPVDTLTLSVTGVDEFGCSSAADFTINTIEFPTAQVTASSLAICEGNPIEVTVSTDINNQILWNTGDTTSSMEDSPSSTTYYVVSVSNAYCTTIDSIEVEVYDNPQINFQLSQTTFCNYNDAVQLVASPANGVFSGTGVSGTTFNPAIGDGTYVITYSFTDANNCTSEASNTVLVDACLSVLENDWMDVTVFPNPATSFLTVQSELSIDWIQLIDNSGRVVSDFSPQSSVCEIAVSDLECGSYVILITFENKMNKLIRFVKQ